MTMTPNKYFSRKMLVNNTNICLQLLLLSSKIIKMKSTLMKDFEDWVNCMHIWTTCNIVWWHCLLYCSNFLWFSPVLLSAVGPVAHTSTPLFTLWILGDGSATSVTESTSVSVNCVTKGAIFCFLNFFFKP